MMKQEEHDSPQPQRVEPPYESLGSVERAYSWINEIADAYGWHLLLVSKTVNKIVVDLHAYGTHLVVRLSTGKATYSANAFRLGGYVPVCVTEFGSFENAEQWIWKLTQKARQKAGKPPLTKSYRRPCSW